MSAWKPRYCKWCNAPIKRAGGGKDAKKYCGKKCYFDAVRAGRQQFKGRVHNAWASLVDWAHDWDKQRVAATASQRLLRQCDVCQAVTESSEHRFCSRACMYAWRGSRPCSKCQCVVPNAQSHGSVTCQACKRARALLLKKRYGHSFRARARKYGALYEPVPRREIYARDGWKCQLCNRQCKRHWTFNASTGRPHPMSPTIDHIVPLSRGGHHVYDNLQLACWGCNVRKGALRQGQLRLAIAKPCRG